MKGRWLSLRLGLPLVVAIYTAIAGLLTLALTLHRADQRVLADQRAEMVQQLNTLQGNLAVQLRQGALEEAQRQVVDLSVATDVVLVALVDEQWRVVVASRQGWQGEPLNDHAPHLTHHHSSEHGHRQVDLYHDEGRDHLVAHTWVDLPTADPLVVEEGTLLWVRDLRDARATERSVAVASAAAYGSLMLAFAVVLAWGLRRWLATRLDALSAAASALAAGDHSARAQLGGNDEFGQLGASFDAMAERIAQSTRDQRRLAAALAQSTDAVVLTDAHGVVVYANPGWSALTGLEGDETLGRPLDQLLPSESAASPLFRLRRPDGTEALVQLTATALVGDDGGAGGRAIALRDQTALSLLQDQLTQAQKMEAVGQLAGGVAHDFNNLLTIILGNAQLLGDDVDGDEVLAAEIIDASERAAEITGQLLAFSRKGPVRVEALQLDEVVDKVQPLLQRLLPPAIELHLELEPVPPISADRTQLEQALLNLAVNARDAMPDGGHLTVRLGQRTTRIGDQLLPCVSLWVIDNGPGMSEATARRAFEPFFTTKGVNEGTGLGLAMVHGIVERFGGSIHLTTSPGAGCRFELDFPIVKGATLPGSAPGLELVPRRVGSALLCEDSDPVRSLMHRVLTRAGLQVTSTALPSEALAAARQGAFDVLVTDVVMPEMDGISLAKAVRALHPELPVVLVSGYPRDHLTGRGLDELDAELVAKPFGEGELVKAVVEAIGQGEGRRSQHTG